MTDDDGLKDSSPPSTWEIWKKDFMEGYQKRDEEIKNQSNVPTSERVEKAVSSAIVDAVLNPVGWIFRIFT